MGTFYANPALMSFHAGKMATEALDVGDVATQLEAIAKKVEGMESLEKHGYARMIRQAKKEVAFRAEMLEHCVKMLEKTADLYSRYENKAMATFEGKELEPEGPTTVKDESLIDRIGEAWCGGTSGSVACSLLSDSFNLDSDLAAIDGNYGILELEGNGSAGSSGREAHIRGKDEIAVLRGGVNGRLGTKDNNVHVRIKGNAGHVVAEGDANLSANKGNAGGGVKGNLAANAIDAEAEIGATIAGTEYNIAVLPSVGLGGYAEGKSKDGDDAGTVYGFALGPFGVRLSKKEVSD